MWRSFLEVKDFVKYDNIIIFCNVFVVREILKFYCVSVFIVDWGKYGRGKKMYINI